MAKTRWTNLSVVCLLVRLSGRNGKISQRESQLLEKLLWPRLRTSNENLQTLIAGKASY